jgi:serine/threonine-protein kinase
MGTPKYLAPERIAGREATPESDLYSVAVIGYEMVAGKPPFKGEDVAATLAAHQRSPVPSLLEVRPDAPPEYVAAIERGLAKDPAARFATAEKMRDALTQPAYDETMAVPTMTLPVTPVPMRDPDPTPTPPPPRRRAAAAPAAASAPTKTKAKTKTTPTTRRRPVWPWVLVCALVLGLVAGAIVLLTNGGEPLPTSAEDPSVTTPQTTPPSLPPSLVPQVPQNLGQLIALLGANPAKYGTRGPELLGKLQSFRSSPSSDGATRLIDEISGWVNKGELNPVIGATAIRVLSSSVSIAQEDEGDDGERVPPGQAKKGQD